MKILLAYDGSECSDRALDDLARSGLPDEVEALVLTVAEVWMPPPSGYNLDEDEFAARPLAILHEAERLANRARDTLISLYPTWVVRADTDRGSPAWDLLDKAGTWNADLIVLGSHGYSALGRFFVGSVSHKVATHAPCSVRVVRLSPPRCEGPLRLVLALKGAPSSDAAARSVAARRWPEGTRVRLVTAFGPAAALQDRAVEITRRIREFHFEAAKSLTQAGLEVTSDILDGDPRHAIVDLAEEWDADAIFVGTRDLNLKGRLLLGSVSTAILNKAHCTVEIVRER